MSYEENIAHVRVLADGSFETQPLLEHLLGVAELAQSYAERITACREFGEIGYLLGLLHDVGKYQEGFQRYIRREFGLDTSLTAWHTPHSPTGALYVNQLERAGWGEALHKILTLCIASHHRGLYDDAAFRSLFDNSSKKRLVDPLLKGLAADSHQLES